MKQRQLNLLIQRNRYINYSAHFSAREFMKTLPAEPVQELAQVALLKTPFPILNIFGAVHDHWLPENIQKLIDSYWPGHLSPLFNPYYLSEEGWDGFQMLWKALPEPENIQVTEIRFGTPGGERIGVQWIPTESIPQIALLSRTLTLAG